CSIFPNSVDSLRKRDRASSITVKAQRKSKSLSGESSVGGLKSARWSVWISSSEKILCPPPRLAARARSCSLHRKCVKEVSRKVGNFPFLGSTAWKSFFSSKR